MENRTPFFIKKETNTKNAYFYIDSKNGFRLFSVIPLGDGDESIYVIDNPNLKIDINSSIGLSYIDNCLREHFNHVINTYDKHLEYPYTIADIELSKVSIPIFP